MLLLPQCFITSAQEKERKWPQTMLRGRVAASAL